MTRYTVIMFLMMVLAVWPGYANAGWKADIGYTDLSDALGVSLPDGSGIDVTQVESYSSGHYMPDTGNSDFSGKTITDQTGSDTGFSSHATTVGRNFYGNTVSIAPGITIIDVYETVDWLQDGFLNAGRLAQPGTTTSQIANHSYSGSFGGDDIDSQTLRRLDWVIETNNYFQCVGLQNSASVNSVLPGSAFNALTVGKIDGNHSRTSVSLVDSYSDTVYEAIRVKPDVVAPLGVTSVTTAVGSGAIALLMDAGSGSTNADNAEVLKAALMAGAHRRTRCDCDAGDYIGDYRAEATDQTDNGLDKRFGAGQLNIYESYYIIDAGEQNSGGSIGVYGFDYNPAFGGLSGSNAVETYSFTGDAAHSWLAVSLVWHVDIDGGNPALFNGDAIFYDMDLVLYDVTDGQEVASAKSAWDNTENLWVPVTAGHQYEIRVQRGSGQAAFLWDYGLAWRLVPDETGDQDGDGLPDTWETQYGLDNTDPADALNDGDADGLTNLEEFCRGTDPTKTDTDGDGLADGAEFAIWQDSCVDSDGDGLANLVDADSDNDKINDGAEYNYWGTDWDGDYDGDGLYNLIDPDSDNDGYLDGREIEKGADPADENDFPAYAVPGVGVGGLAIGVFGLLCLGACMIIRSRFIQSR